MFTETDVSSSLVAPRRIPPVNSSDGPLVRMLITPADALLPNSVDCGPRSTSIASISDKSENACSLRTKGTSSTMTATLGSILVLKTLVPIPRRLKLLFVAQSPRLIVSEGEILVISVNSSMPSASIVLASTTLIATGTSCTLSARLVAVTTTSSMARFCDIAAGAKVEISSAGSNFLPNASFWGDCLMLLFITSPCNY